MDTVSANVQDTCWGPLWERTARPSTSALPPVCRKTSRSSPLRLRSTQAEEEKDGRLKEPCDAGALSPSAEWSTEKVPNDRAVERFSSNLWYRSSSVSPHESRHMPPSPVLSNATDDNDDDKDNSSDDMMPMNKRNISENDRKLHMRKAQISERFCHPSAMKGFHKRAALYRNFSQTEVSEECGRAASEGSMQMMNSAVEYTENDVSIVRAIALALLEEQEKRDRSY